jgi:hypothetical protein
MSSFQWIQHRGKRILYSDLAGKNTEEILDEIARVKVELGGEPLESVLALINVKGGKISTEINNAFKNLAKDGDPYMKMTAIIGLEGLQTIMLNSILMFTRTKKITVKNSKEEALDCLAGL